MPASKIRYALDDGLAGKMVSLKGMFEAPRPKRRKRKEYSDARSSDDIFQSKEGEKKGTTQYHLARALENMLMLANVGGLATWIEENPPCRMLGTTEYRYGAKDLAPFENHYAEVWQRWCVEETETHGVSKFRGKRGSPSAPCWWLLRTSVLHRSHYYRV